MTNTLKYRELDTDDWERMNVPAEFRKVRTEAIAVSVRERVKNYLLNLREAKERGVGLWVVGGTGVGKTSIGVAVARLAMMQGMTAYFTTVAELRECIHSRTMFDSDKTVWERVQDVGVLVLDAFSTAELEDHIFGEKEIEHLLTSRGSRQRITIVTVSMTGTATSKTKLYARTLRYMVVLEVIGENRSLAVNNAAIALLEPRRGKGE
jgi:DNA replication protein DnaC